MIVKDAVEFLRANQHRSGVLATWTEKDMVWWVMNSIRNEAITYHLDEKSGELDGITLCRKDLVNRVMFVMMCVATNTDALKSMLGYFKINYPNWKLIGKRHGNQIKHFNTNKLWEAH